VDMGDQMPKRLSSAHTIALLALFISLGGAGYSATGGNFILGRTNAASTVTALTAPLNGRAFQINNTSAGANATALGLVVAAGKPPMYVSSAALVARLNADLLDNRHANGFLRVARNGVNDTGTGATLTDKVTVTLDAPTAGFVLVTGTSNILTGDSGCTPCYWHQRLRDGSGNVSTVNFTSVGFNARAIATNVWVFPVTAGSQTFGLEAAGVLGTVGLENPTITALFVPFGPTGTVAGISTVSSASEAARLGRVQRDGTRRVLN